MPFHHEQIVHVPCAVVIVLGKEKNNNELEMNMVGSSIEITKT